MYSEATETARLYQLLSAKLGNDTTEAMFKYIDSKTDRAVKSSIKALATKDDLAHIREEIRELRAKTIKWILIWGAGQIGAVIVILLLFIKK